MAMENVESTKVTIVGFENKQDLLDEINFRYKLINKCNILLKKIPTQLTRIAMRDLVPDMTTCRYPEKTTKKANYAFIQFANDALVDKYVELLNKKQLYGKSMVASKLKPETTFTDVNIFDLKKLYFNGLKPETKYYEIKEIFPNAKVNLPVHEDKSCCGYVTLTFESEEEAMNAFMENKLTLHGVKCHLIFLIKSHQKKNVEESKKNFTPANPKELLIEIVSRFQARNNCTVMVKNLPADFNLSKLKDLVPYKRNCKICIKRKRGFLDFDNSELALQAVKELNGKMIGNKTARAFIHKKAIQFHDLSSFDLSKLFLTNLPMDTTETDVKPFFPKAEIELHRNTDNTCIGTAILTFSNKEEALKIFNQTNIKIKNVDVHINFSTETKIIANKADNQNGKKSLLENKVETDEMNKHIGIKRKHNASSHGKQISQNSELCGIVKDSTQYINKENNEKKMMSGEGESGFKKSKLQNENTYISKEKIETNKDKKKKRKNKHDKSSRYEDVTRTSDLTKITKPNIIKEKNNSNVKSTSSGSLGSNINRSEPRSLKITAKQTNVGGKESNCKKPELEDKIKFEIINDKRAINDKKRKKKKQKSSQGKADNQTSVRPDVTKLDGIIDNNSVNINNKTLGGLNNNIKKSEDKELHIKDKNLKCDKKELPAVNTFKTGQEKNKTRNIENENPSLSSQQSVSHSFNQSEKTSQGVKSKSPNRRNDNKVIKSQSVAFQNDAQVKCCEMMSSSPKKVETDETKITVDKDKKKRKKIKHKKSSFGQVSESPVLRPDTKQVNKSSSNVKIGSPDNHNRGKPGKENGIGSKSKVYNKGSKPEKRQFDSVETDDSVLQPSKKPRVMKENSRGVIKK